MILTNEQLRTTFTGTAEIIEKNGILCPYRFGRYMRESVYPPAHRFHAKPRWTAGVVCRFTTDSHTLSFTFAVDLIGEGQSFDVWANGVFLSHTVCTELTGRVELALPYDESRVEIYFPSHREGRIFDVTLDNGASFSSPNAPAYRILFKGDSITHGSTTRFTSMGYTHQVARALNAHIVNQGIGGEEFNPAAADTELNFDPDLIVLAFGTNDWSHAPSHSHMVGAVYGHLAALRDLYPDKKIAMILPIWRADHALMNKPTGSFEDACAIFREAAMHFNVNVIEGWALVPHITDVFADARLHPDEFGFQFYAENLTPHLKKLLEA